MMRVFLLNCNYSSDDSLADGTCELWLDTLPPSSIYRSLRLIFFFSIVILLVI